MNTSMGGGWATTVIERPILWGGSEKRRQLVNNRAMGNDSDPKNSALSYKVGLSFYHNVSKAEDCFGIEKICGVLIRPMCVHSRKHDNCHVC